MITLIKIIYVFKYSYAYVKNKEKILYELQIDNFLI